MQEQGPVRIDVQSPTTTRTWDKTPQMNPKPQKAKRSPRSALTCTQNLGAAGIARDADGWVPQSSTSTQMGVGGLGVRGQNSGFECRVSKSHKVWVLGSGTLPGCCPRGAWHPWSCYVSLEGWRSPDACSWCSNDASDAEFCEYPEQWYSF